RQLREFPPRLRSPGGESRAIEATGASAEVIFHSALEARRAVEGLWHHPRTLPGGQVCIPAPTSRIHHLHARARRPGNLRVLLSEIHGLQESRQRQSEP